MVNASVIRTTSLIILYRGKGVILIGLISVVCGLSIHGTCRVGKPCGYCAPHSCALLGVSQILSDFQIREGWLEPKPNQRVSLNRKVIALCIPTPSIFIAETKIVHRIRLAIRSAVADAAELAIIAALISLHCSSTRSACGHLNSEHSEKQPASRVFF